MARWVEDIVGVLAVLGGVGTLDEIYLAIEKRRGGLSRTWRDTVRRTIQQNSSDTSSFLHKEDLFYSVSGLGGGVWGLRNHNHRSPLAVDSVNDEKLPKRVSMSVSRIIRDTNKSIQLKTLYGNRCQLCGIAFDLGDGKLYSEAHHIRPIGMPHNGPDCWENMVVLCPNHHAQCDYGGVHLSKEVLLIIEEHEIGDEYVAYHNNTIYRNREPLA